MRLRLQLILVSVLALCLPWAGCTYIRDMETVLRQGQQQALLSTARAVAMTIDGRPELVEELANTDSAEYGASTLYLHSATRYATADGYPDEWRDVQDDFQEFYFPDFSGRVNFYAATNGPTAWLYFDVTDDSVSYHNPSQPGIANGDHIILSLVSNGFTQRYWLTPEAPGELSARTLLSGQILTDSRIHGAWRDTESGFQLELSLPTAMIGNYLGFTVINSPDPNQWAGSMPPAGRPGRVIRSSTGLASVLKLFTRNNLQLSVVDGKNWLRASTGSLNQHAPATDSTLPGAWLLEALYRWIMDDPAATTRYETPRQGKLVRAEITDALNGGIRTTWYASDEQTGSAIVSAAFPLTSAADNTIVGAVVAEQTSDQVLSLTNAAMTRLLLITLVATLIIGFGLVAYASWLSFRIRRLSRHVTSVMAPDGHFSATFPEKWGSDELGDLGHNFGDLLGRIREYTEYLRTLSSKLSHELRTPLAVVRSSLDNLEQEQSPEQSHAQMQRYLERARQGSARLSHILNAMSSAGRVEESIATAETTPVLLNNFLVSNVDGYRIAYPDHAIDLQLPATALTIEGSPELLAQMLDKLMDNAADFCSDDGRIVFRLTICRNNARITVSNDGPSLPESMSSQLFDSMVSIRKGKDEKPHLGLGLTIVRLVVDFHHGTVSAHNFEDGAGVSFVIDLPLGSDKIAV